MATPTSQDRYVEAQLSIAKGALARAQEAIKSIDGLSNSSASILQTRYASKMREIRSAQIHVKDALEKLNSLR